MHQRRLLVLGIGIFVLLVVSLQIFLLMVGLEAWLNYNAPVAWGAAGTSVVLAGFVVLLARFLSRGPRTIHTTARPTRIAPASRGPSVPLSSADRGAREGQAVPGVDWSATTDRPTV
jgi:membrane protein implicated in regulation of membrane protease activity